jgi:hypothetical protein
MSGSAYHVTHSITADGDDKGIINLEGSATMRIYLYDLKLSCSGAPVDAQVIVHVNRSTAIGSGGTGLTEQKVDPLTVNAASATTVGGDWTADPTDGNTLEDIAFNGRVTGRFAAIPKHELVSAATAANGLFIVENARSTGSPVVRCTVSWRE